MPSRESSLENLAKAQARWRRPRPLRSKEEGQMIWRLVFWWFTGRNHTKPSGRDWARQLGISHTWLQKLVREFTADPSEMRRLQIARGDPTFAQLSRARENTNEMRKRGELRLSRLAEQKRKFWSGPKTDQTCGPGNGPQMRTACRPLV